MAAMIPATITKNPSPPIPSITLAAITEANTSTEPIDRSMPEVMMMKVIPTPRTARAERFWLIREKFCAEKNRLPPATAKNATMTTSTPRIQTACISPSRL